MVRVLNPLLGLNFSLATNAAILNTWTQTPLILSGIWVPPTYNMTNSGMGPVMPATDVASTFDDNRQPYVEEFPSNEPSLSDKIFEMIMKTPETDFIDQQTPQKDLSPSQFPKEVEPEVKEEKDNLKGKFFQKEHQPSPTNSSPKSTEEVNIEENRSLSPDTGIDTTEEPSISGPDHFNMSDVEDSLTRSISVVSGTNEYSTMLTNLTAVAAAEGAILHSAIPDFLLPVTPRDEGNEDQKDDEKDKVLMSNLLKVLEFNLISLSVSLWSGRL